MFCPNCGAKNSKKQNYCRFCGLNLQDTAKSLTSQIVFGEDSGLVKSLSSAKRIIDLFLAAIVGIVIVCGIGYFFFALDFGRSVMKFGLVVFFLLEALLGAIGYYQRQERGKSKTKRFESNEIAQFEAKDTAKLLKEQPIEPVVSFVENSTELFPIENKTRRL